MECRMIGVNMKLLIITGYKLKMMLSDRLFFAAMVIIPLLITIASGYALRYEKSNVIPIAIVDEDNSGYSRTLVDRLAEKEGFKIESATGEKALEMLKGSKVEEVFIIKKGFEGKIVNGENQGIIDLIKSPSSFSADFVSEVVAGEVIRFITGNMAADWVVGQYEKNGKPVSDTLADEVISYTDMQWDPKPLMTINYQEMEGGAAKEVQRVYIPAATATSAGIIVVFIMFFVLFSSGWLIEERRNGTLKRLISGPDALIYSFFGNIFALIISGMLQVALFSVIDKLLFDVDIFTGILSYLVFFAYLLSVISISLFLSSILKTPAQLQAGAPVFVLLTGFAGGCFWNFVEVSDRLKVLSKLTPQGWALEGINRLLLYPGSLSVIALPVTVLLGISLILIPLSYIIIEKQVAK